MRWTRAELACAVLVPVFAGLALWAGIENERRWQRLLKEQECVVVKEVAAQTARTSGYDSHGKYVSSTTTIPGSTTWRCQGGKEYTR